MRRGANADLTREIPDLSGLVLGVAWNAGPETVLDRTLVFAAILCDAGSRALSDEHFVFFNQLTSPDLSTHELDVALDGDKEQIEVDLSRVPAEVERIVATVYVNDGPGPRRTLGQLRSCVLRVLDAKDNRELLRSEDLAAGLTSETALALGEVYRHAGGWRVKVLGQGYSGGISALAGDYGLAL
jgi:tellurium resistance protein TerD